MHKLQLIEKFRKETDFSKTDAAKIIDLIFSKMAETLAKGDREEIRGLCSFYVKEYKGYTGRDPKTGAKVPIKPKNLPFFKAGKELKERVNR